MTEGLLYMSVSGIIICNYSRERVWNKNDDDFSFRCKKSVDCIHVCIHLIVIAVNAVSDNSCSSGDHGILLTWLQCIIDFIFNTRTRLHARGYIIMCFVIVMVLILDKS